MGVLCWIGAGVGVAVSGGPWALALEGAAAVINLAGRSVNCRYTPTNRAAIRDSRIVATRVIGEAIACCQCPPQVWLNASTATWYRHAEDRAQNDWLGEPGAGFSYEVAQAWEDAFFGAPTPAATRKLALRIGLVLANEPGTVFDVFRQLSRWGLGGAMGTGSQRVSWLHIEDLLRAVAFAIEDPFLDGVLNLTAPEHPTNRVWMRHFRELVGMPVGLPAARWILALGARMMGTEPELVLKSRWVESVRLRDAGFHWRWPSVVETLADLRDRRGLARFFRAATPRSVGARGWLPELHPADRR